MRAADAFCPAASDERPVSWYAIEYSELDTVEVPGADRITVFALYAPAIARHVAQPATGFKGKLDIVLAGKYQRAIRGWNLEPVSIVEDGRTQQTVRGPATFQRHLNIEGEVAVIKA